MDVALCVVSSSGSHAFERVGDGRWNIWLSIRLCQLEWRESSKFTLKYFACFYKVL
jgi:hypothetical protein